MAGSNVAFQVTATGSGTLGYQWQLNGVNITGATATSLSLTNIQPANAGTYTVIVTDSTGSTTSQASTLTTQPASQFVAAGSDVTFNYGPTGQAPFTYQWKLNGSNLSGATSATYTLSSVTTAKAGGYSVTATDANGVVSNSWLAVLTVLPTIPSGTFTISGTAGTDNTTAIASAITSAKNAGGGTVVLPGPGVFYSQSITLPANTRLQINSGATLMALPYTASGSLPAYSGTTDFITISSGTNNVEITGGGIIDGNGQEWWTAYNNNNSITRPRLIRFDGSSSKSVNNIYVHNITLQNSMSFHIICGYTNNITFSDVTVSAPSTSPNTDAIDPGGNNILYDNCTINNGDDDIAVKAGNTPSSNIAVYNCAFGTGHGVSVGGQTNLGLNGMIVTNCTFNGTTNGLRLKADPTQGGLVENLTYANISMTGVQYPIVFYSYYKSTGNPGDGTAESKAASWNSSPPNTLPGAATSFWKNIVLSDLNTSGTTGDHNVIWGLPLASTTPDGFISNVLLNNVSLDKNVDIIDAYDTRCAGSTSLSFFTYNALIITSQPVSTTTNTGGAATFTMATAGTSGVATVQSPAIQWYFNDAALTNGTQSDGTTVAGATTTTLSLGNVQPGHAGSYTAKAGNSLDSYSGSLTAHNYAVSSTSSPAVLTVSATPAAVTLGNLGPFTYDGAAKAATASTTPSGLNVALTYNGSSTAPSDAGSYSVEATVTSPGYTGSISGTLKINPAGQTITFGSLAPVTYGSAPITLAATDSSGLPITYISDNTAVATVSGNIVTIVGVGTAHIIASQSGNTDYNAANPISETLTVQAAPASDTPTMPQWALIVVASLLVFTAGHQ